jgi:hypothetical protein
VKPSHRRLKRRTDSVIPVLKLPPELALPALDVLAGDRSASERRAALVALRPSVPPRTMLNAYVLPSLADLKLFDGTLRTGRVTRYGMSIARATARVAQALMAKHLIGVDSDRVGFVSWLAEQPSSAVAKQSAPRRFAVTRLGTSTDDLGAVIDRLGKWIGYLVFFRVLRESTSHGLVILSVSTRQIAALAGSQAQSVRALGPDAKRNALLQAYSLTSLRLGTRLYLPVSKMRDELGRQFEASQLTLSDAQLDDIIREAPDLLKGHIVSFSPFSGPARDGIAVDQMYAGYISIRQQLDARRGRSK